VAQGLERYRLHLPCAQHYVLTFYYQHRRKAWVALGTRARHNQGNHQPGRQPIEALRLNDNDVRNRAAVASAVLMEIELCYQSVENSSPQRPCSS
jgi:hypothetical protein